jgi:hypothetical protein
MVEVFRGGYTYVIINQIKQPLRDVCQGRKNAEKAPPPRPLFSIACSLAGRYDNPICARFLATNRLL